MDFPRYLFSTFVHRSRISVVLFVPAIPFGEYIFSLSLHFT